MSEIRYTPPAATSGPTGSGAAGQVTFWSASTVLSGSNNLFWDNTNGRLGIGTNAPASNLDVVGTSNLRDVLTVGTTGIAGTINFYRPSGSVIGQIAAYGTGNGGYVNFGAGYLYMDNNYHTTLATSILNLNGFFGIKTAGSTSATIGLLIQNSSSTKTFQVDDTGAGYFANDTNIMGKIISNNSGGMRYTYPNLEIHGSFSGGSGYGIDFVDNNGVVRYAKFRYYGSIFSDYEQNPSLVGSSIFTLNSITKGFLPPRMTDAQILAISSPAAGLMAYSTTQSVLAFYDGAGWRKVNHAAL